MDQITDYYGGDVTGWGETDELIAICFTEKEAERVAEVRRKSCHPWEEIDVYVGYRDDKMYSEMNRLIELILCGKLQLVE
jgi:hypothetical protein